MWRNYAILSHVQTHRCIETSYKPLERIESFAAQQQQKKPMRNYFAKWKFWMGMRQMRLHMASVKAENNKAHAVVPDGNSDSLQTKHCHYGETFEMILLLQCSSASI